MSAVGVPSFESVYREHYRFAWHALRRMGIAEGDVPDALQDVFLGVHRSLPAFEGRSKLSTWLFGICLWTARNRLRKARHEPRAATLDEHDIADETADPSLEATRRQDLAVLES